MIKNKYAAFALFAALCIAICNALDWLYARFVTQSAYQFTVLDDLLIPLIAAVVIGYFLFLRKPSQKKS